MDVIVNRRMGMRGRKWRRWKGEHKEKEKIKKRNQKT